MFADGENLPSPTARRPPRHGPPATTLVPSNQPTPEGVAIPHVRLEQVKSPSGIMVRLKDPIDFNAVDEQPVDLVCLLLLSKENESAQLKVLAGIARRLRRLELLEELRRAPNRVVLYNLLIGRTGLYRSQ